MPSDRVDEYILQAPEIARNHLKQMRSILQSVAPEATELLKWGKPVFESGTILFAYSAHRSHLSFIPTGPSLSPFLGELSGYIVRKDSVQFPYSRPLPQDLIRRIAQFRKDEVLIRNAKWKY